MTTAFVEFECVIPRNGKKYVAAVNVNEILYLKDNGEQTSLHFRNAEMLPHRLNHPLSYVGERLQSALAACKEKRGKSPLYIPLKENTENNIVPTPRAREEASTRFVPPLIEDVRAYIEQMGYDFDAQQFISYYISNGWKVGRNKMKSWRHACDNWHYMRMDEAKRDAAKHEHYDAKMDERGAKLTAHIDAKMDEREKKREAKRGSGGGSRRPDNWIEATERERKEFLDGLES